MGIVSGITDSRMLEDDLSSLADEDGIAFDPADADEVAAILALKDEVGDEWSYGVTLIPDSDFEDYARDLAEDTGAVSDDASWPMTCIDWTQAARELKHDYSCVSVQGEDVWFRS